MFEKNTQFEWLHLEPRLFKIYLVYSIVVSLGNIREFI